MGVTQRPIMVSDSVSTGISGGSRRLIRVWKRLSRFQWQQLRKLAELVTSNITTQPISLEEVDSMPLEVIVDSSPCSATCGLGIKTQTLCLLKDGETATEEVTSKDGTEVKCLESWQCGLRTMTVTSGQRLEIDCLGEVMEAMGRFSWRVAWRYARGIITSDDSLFIRWDAPLLDRVILDPIREEDAGTYCCVVQDVTLRRVKRAYWGIRVLPSGFLNLDYESSLAQWDLPGNQQNETVSDQHDHKTDLLYTILISLSLSGIAAGLMLLLLYWTVKRSEPRPFDRLLFDLGLGDELVVTVERLAAEDLGETNPNPVGIGYRRLLVTGERDALLGEAAALAVAQLAGRYKELHHRQSVLSEQLRDLLLPSEPVQAS
ncbi:Transmembrane protein 81 [Liparis tanakae]|uniref:Transmembrane protein 81 n=1 Tax=Liparis tanakae TaxID=230148 RepID=A0A4Z2IQB4_9TELE|nr:Transmembrane protein 81 [Liparis tanakae]